MKNQKKIINDIPCKCRIVSLDLLSIFLKYKDRKNCIEAILRDIKSKFGIITEEDIACVTEHFNITEQDIKAVVESTKEFEIVPVQTHLIRVCSGVSCKNQGGNEILKTVFEELKLEKSGITEDEKFKLEIVDCVNLCEISPVMAINSIFYGKINQNDVRALIAKEKQKIKRNL